MHVSIVLWLVIPMSLLLALSGCPVDGLPLQSIYNLIHQYKSCDDALMTHLDSDDVWILQSTSGASCIVIGR
jgi:hypothetical protein